MAQHLMQARSSADGLLKTWLSSAPDFAAAGFPGPGSAQYVAVAQRQGGISGGETNTISSVGSGVSLLPTPSKVGVDLRTRSVLGVRGITAKVSLSGLELEIGPDELDQKQSVYLATTTNITLSGAQTADGVSTGNNRRISVIANTNPAENGVWISNSSGAWTRARDFDENAEVTCGAWFDVETGDTLGGKAFKLATQDPIVIGVTALAFVERGGGTYPDVEYVDLPDSDQTVVLEKRKTVIFAGARTGPHDLTIDASEVPEGSEITVVQLDESLAKLVVQPGGESSELFEFDIGETGFVKLMKRIGADPDDLVIVKSYAKGPDTTFAFQEVTTDADITINLAARRTVVQIDVGGTDRTLTLNETFQPDGTTVLVNGTQGWAVARQGGAVLWEFDQVGEAVELLQEDGQLALVAVVHADRIVRIVPGTTIGAGTEPPEIQTQVFDPNFLNAYDEVQRTTRRKMQTIGAGQGALGSLPIPEGAVVHVAWRILGVQSDGSHKAGKAGSLVVHRNGSGNVTALDTQITIPHFKTDATWGPDAEVGVAIDTVNQALEFTMSGKAATTIDWVLDLSWVIVTTATI